MFRHSLSKTTSSGPSLRSSFTTSTRIMASGDTGAIRPGGVASADAFSKREKANEDYSIRERERAKLQELLSKIQENEKNLANLKGLVKNLSDQHEKNNTEEKK